MSTSHEPAIHAPTSVKGEHTPSSSETRKPNTIRQQFAIFAINMSWQLALVVLVPVIGGAELDKKLNSSMYIFVGLAIAIIGSGVVMWRTAQAANRLPVPKLTADEKKAIKKSYEEEDDD